MSKLLSYLTEQLIERTGSDKNPVLEVSMESGKYVLNTANGNYSFGNLHLVFDEVFRKTHLKEKTCSNALVLGFGAGSVVYLLRNKYKQTGPITAIEYDDKILELGRKYFNTTRYPSLDIINADAYTYVMQCRERYDLIVIDLYDDLEVPAQFETEEFIMAVTNLLRSEGDLYFNKVVLTPEHLRQLKTSENIYRESGVIHTFTIMGLNRVMHLVKK